MRIGRLLPSNQFNFNAKLTRNTVPVENGDGETYDKSTTKKDLVESYNSQIRALREQREIALEFDTFMRSDEMKKRLNNLPQKDEIEMVNKFTTMRVNDDGTIEFDPMILIYKFDDPKSQKRLEDAKYFSYDAQEKLGVFYVQNEDGSLNKRGIKEYIAEISKFLGVKND